MKVMSGLNNKEKKLTGIFNALETFTNTLQTLYGLFDDYNGG
jgi:hypothetical protein